MGRKRFSMKLENKTRYDTRELKSLLMEAWRRLREDGETMEHRRTGRVLKTLNVVVTPSRNHYRCSGRAYLNGFEMRLHPTYSKVDGGFTESGNDEFKPDPDMPADLVATFYHELYHNLGLKHEDMPHGAVNSNVAYGHLAEWAEDRFIPFEDEDNDSDDKDELAEQRERYKKRLEKLKEWRRKLKMAETKFDTWHRKASYYEREYPDMAEEVREEHGFDDADSIRDDVT